ncbi:MAG TPA: hypothetical protein VEN78_03680 [Bradyrhizobium sp.]|nr:hypothetical protein [Bradyrhizobium sp.]
MREVPATHFPLLPIALLSGIARPMDGFKMAVFKKAVFKKVLLEIWRKCRDQFRIRAAACIGP